MKELSIEEKAKAYDEALKAAIIAHKDEDRHLKATLERIFPELKESEDERISKALIHLISEQDGFLTAINGISIKDILAWLEKQGEKVIDCPQNHQDVGHPNGCIVLEDFNDGEGFYKLNLDYLNKKQVEEIEELVRAWNTELNSLNDENIRACIGMCLADADEQRFNNYNTNLKECIAWLDKQGGQKPVDNQFTLEQASVLDTHIDKFIGQKPADKAEPKFKVGDWIVTDNQTVLFVDKIYEYDYYVIDTNNWLPYKYTIKVADEKCHLWTIADAKDGDVLAVTMYPEGTRIILDLAATMYHEGTGTWIGIFKKQDDCDCGFSSHCFVNTEGIFKQDGYNHGNEKAAHPATKEQRDLLFAKMKEASYEWDAGKKELKKIGQTDINWSREDEQNLNATLSYINDECLRRWLKDALHRWLKDVLHTKYYNHAWSEEDSRILNAVIKDIQERHPEAMWEINTGNTAAVSTGYIIDWLKRLKERHSWKPTDEQMTALKESCDKQWEPDGLDPLYTLYQDLKKMKGE